nr:MAG TPA: hypothetical protein [Caudoviricetes sp.]
MKLLQLYDNHLALYAYTYLKFFYFQIYTHHILLFLQIEYLLHYLCIHLQFQTKHLY